MDSENPYVAPVSGGALATPKRISPPLVFSGILLLTGTAFLLLLNGQHFTNRTIFLGFVACSAFLWYGYRTRVRVYEPRAGRFALLVHLVVFVAVAATLPGEFSRQNSFEKAIERLKSEKPTQ